MNGLKVFRVDDQGESVWVIADGPERAREISRECVEPCGDGGNETVFELPADALLAIRDNTTGEETERRVDEWLLLKGEGGLCTSMT